MFSTRKHGSTCPYCSMVVEPGAKPDNKALARVADDDKTMPYLGKQKGSNLLPDGWYVLRDRNKVKITA